MTENERFLRKRFKIRNDQHYNTKLFCSQKVFPKPTICLIKHKIESENQIFGSRLLNRNMTTSIIKPLYNTEEGRGRKFKVKKLSPLHAGKAKSGGKKCKKRGKTKEE